MFILALLFSFTSAIQDNDWYMGGIKRKHYSFSISTEAYSGYQSAQLTGDSNHRKAYGLVIQKHDATSMDSTTCIISCRIKKDNPNTQAGLYIKITGGRYYPLLDIENLGSEPSATDTSSWQLYTSTFTFPKGCELIYVGAILKGSGTIWIDDFQVHHSTDNERIGIRDKGFEL